MIELLIIALKLNAALACAATFCYLAFSSLSVVYISLRKDRDFWVNSQQFVTGKLYPNLRSKSARTALWATVSLVLLVTLLKLLSEDQGNIKPTQADITAACCTVTKNPIKLKTITLPDSRRSSGIAKSYLLTSNLYLI